jgi:hypothetical protein
MKSALDKKFSKGWREFRAGDYVNGLKMLDRMNEMLPMSRIKDTMEYSEEHSYGRDKAEQELARRVLDAQLGLLEIIWPEKFGETEKPEEEE